MSEINKEAITDDMFELLDESEKNSEFIAMVADHIWLQTYHS